MKKILLFITLFVVNLVLTDNIKAYNIYKSYEVGEQVEVAGENYYVIADSDSDLDYVTLLKEEPLTVDEVNTYGGVGTDNNHVNRYTVISVGTSWDRNGYGAMAFYSSETCGYTTPRDYSSLVETGCTTDYDKSDIKYVVDAWAKDKFQNNELKEVGGYKTRLINIDDLSNNLGYERHVIGTMYASTNGETPSWVYNIQYNYWTMSSVGDSSMLVWCVMNDGKLLDNGGHLYDPSEDVVRPVINLVKKVEGVIDDGSYDDSPDQTEINDKDNKNSSTIVKVADTLLHEPMIPIIIGLVVIGLGLTIYIVILRKKK